MPLKVTLNPFGRLVGSCPRMLIPDTTPCTPGNIPVASMVTISPGEIQPGGGHGALPAMLLVWKLAPFTKVKLVGPGRRALRLNATAKLPNVAVIVMGPAEPPAVTGPVVAIPCALVVAVAP